MKTFACSLETHHQILILNKTENLKKIIKKSDCDQETLAQFAQFASNANGVIGPRVFSQLFKNVTISPAKVRFISLNDKLRDSDLLPKDARLEEVKKLNGSAVVVADHDQRLEITCSGCPSVGDNTLRITLRDQLGQELQSHWVQASIAVAINTLVANTTIPSGLAALTPSHFTRKTIYSTKPHALVNSNLPIHFYKISRPLVAGEALEKSFISPVQLVRPGAQVQVTVRDNNILLHGMAVPLGHGVYGQRIQLKNLKSSRIISGTVVDHNKVLVEL